MVSCCSGTYHESESGCYHLINTEYMTKQLFSKWQSYQNHRKVQKHASSPTKDCLKVPLRLITHCHVLSRCVGLTPFYYGLLGFLSDCRGKFFASFKIWHGSHGNHGLPSLPIPPPCVAPRPSRFLHGGLKRGRRCQAKLGMG